MLRGTVESLGRKDVDVEGTVDLQLETAGSVGCDRHRDGYRTGYLLNLTEYNES